MLAARLPLERLLAATRADVHPPLYYLLLKGWGMLFGSSATAARSLSLLLGLAVLALFYMLSRDRLATIILAYMPSQIFFSSEARMYALFTLLVLAAMAAAGAGRRWLTGLALGAGLLTHNCAAFFAPVPLALLWRQRGWRRGWRDAAMAGLLAAAIWAPWLPAVLRQANFAISGNHWARFYGPGSIAYYLAQAIIAYRVPDGWWWIALLIAIFLMLIFGFKPDWWTALALVPAAAGGFFSAAVTPALIWRSLIPASPGLAMMLANATRRRDVGRVLAALLIALFAFVFFRCAVIGRDVRPPGGLVGAVCQSGKQIYCNDAHCLPLLVEGCNVVFDVGSRWLTADAMRALGLPLADGPSSAQYALLMDAPLSNSPPDYRGWVLREYHDGVYRLAIVALANR